MITLTTRVVNNLQTLEQAKRRAKTRTFARAGFMMMQAARRLILRRRGPSAPGKPPHTHKGQFLKRSIFYAADDTSVVIGPRESFVGPAWAHEFGGTFRKRDYPARPFMRPALERNAEKFAGQFEGSFAR